MSAYDLKIENAYIVEQDSVVDIGIEDGNIARIAPTIEKKGEHILDADEKLVSPSFNDCHMHNDRAFSLCGDPAAHENDYKTTPVGLADSYSFEAFEAYFDSIGFETLVDNMVRDVERAVVAGSGHFRTHPCVDQVDDTRIMEAAIEAKDRLSDIADIQIVPMTNESIVHDGASRELLSESIQLGLEQMDTENILLGGIGSGTTGGKYIDRTIAQWFSIAKEFNVDIDVHLQDHGSIGGYIIERVIDQIENHGYQNRVTASHCFALGDLPNDWVSKIAERGRAVGLKIVTCFSSTPSTFPLRELRERGIPVGHGTDNTHDFVIPFGISDSILAALIEAIKLTRYEQYAEDVLWYQSNEGLRMLWTVLTYQGAEILGIEGYGIQEGNRADMVVLNEPSPEGAIARHARPRYVLKDGSVVAENGQLAE